MAESEVIVIGGGIAGTSAAYFLASYGRRVTLLERGEIASEASGVNAGGIGAYGWGHVPNLESHLTMGSLQIFRALQLDMGYDIEFRASGALQTIQTPAQYEHSREYVLSLKSRGYTVDLLSTDDARAIEPELNPELVGAVHFPLRAQADPVKTTRAFADAARHEGAEVLTEREVNCHRSLVGRWLPNRLSRRVSHGPAAGAGGGCVVRSAGAYVGLADTGHSRARADVGDRASDSQGVSLNLRGRIARPLERRSGQ